MMKKIKIMLSSFFLFVSFFSIAENYTGFEKGITLYQQNKFDEAFLIFSNLAEIGDYSAMFNLGVMYYRGEAIARDPIQAYAWMATAANVLEEADFVQATARIFSAMNDREKREAEEKAREWMSRYSPDEIGKHLFPKPISDEDCEDIPPILKEGLLLYPKAELNAGRMGRVEVEFNISREGYVRDLVVNSATNQEFKRNAVKAAESSIYEPYEIGGEPANYYGVKLVYNFLIKGNPRIRTAKLKAELDSAKHKAKEGDIVAQYILARKLNIFRSFRSYLEGLNLEYREANKWYLSSARQGLPHAQFAIGQNLLAGRGCEVNAESGNKWITAAAVAGYSPAQYHIARSLIKEAGQINELALTWLRNASLSGHYPSKLLLAWELSTSPDKMLRDGLEAITLLKTERGDYHDKVRMFETMAAAHAEIGAFAKAVKYQKKALKKAKRLNWDIPVMQARLHSYNNEQAWVGRYN